MRAVLTVTLEAHDDAVVTLLIETLWKNPGVVGVADALHHLPPQAIRLLRALATDGSLTSATASQRSGIPRHSARALLSTCVTAGAVERIEQGIARGAYRRASTFVLTERGRRLIGKARGVSILGLAEGERNEYD